MYVCVLHFYTWNEFCNDLYPNYILYSNPPEISWNHIQILRLVSLKLKNSVFRISTEHQCCQHIMSTWAPHSPQLRAEQKSAHLGLLSASQNGRRQFPAHPEQNTRKMLSGSWLVGSFEVWHMFFNGKLRINKKSWSLNVFPIGFRIWQTRRYKTKRLQRLSCQDASSKFPNTKCFCRTFRINRRFSELTSGSRCAASSPLWRTHPGDDGMWFDMIFITLQYATNMQRFWLNSYNSISADPGRRKGERARE